MTREKTPGLWRLYVYSAIGVVVFFLPVTFQGKSTILLDHLVTLLRQGLGPAVGWVVGALVLYGTYRGLRYTSWANPTQAIFAVLNVLGLGVATMVLTDTLPGFLARPDIVPFLWEKIAIPVALIIPVGSAFLALLVSFGLLEFVGVLMQPVMRPVWRTPGRSAIDAVASFVGSYSLGLLITDRVYRQGLYTGREAAIIATGFSTVSAAFMVVVANTLGLMDYWGQYFFVSLIITFAVTAITVRIPPLSRIPDDYYPGATPDPEPEITTGRFAAAWAASKEALAKAPSLGRAVGENFADGLRMSAAVVPSILSVGVIGLLLATYTKVFDLLGYLFYPVAWLVRLPEPLLAGKASALGIAEMLLPATVVADQESLVLRFVIGVVSVSAIIFFSALVPCIMATSIPVKVRHLVVIWWLRVALSILLATPIAYLLL
ncbi:YjiH family protein [Corynebacterium lowii]|uniref:Nucleoside recognition n=1 Tax=Corynebacterium lowii TaxID=1544413 RepID=A0A0N8VZT2_9CORY|nr:YjiH family protein [Corynebacterium lowii]KQB84770.1 Nucleoside recognition [Corynebacterium lowii]MDP9851673.1 nucleoside recognition membrane protein YjiH [Corynebacterium lowii]